MALHQLIPSFNAGELSPYSGARSDLEKYDSGCRRLENFVILPYGGIYRRGGTEYIGRAKYDDKRCRLLGFNFSVTTRFILEVGEQYIRFWSNGYQVEDPSDPGQPLEVTTPYLESQLRDLQFVQINDIMYFVHPSHAPRKLSRLADDDWTFAEIAWDWPALLDENIEATMITPSATTGASITLTASAALFESGHVGSYWQIGHPRANAFVDMTISAIGTSSAIKVIGTWDFNTYGTWTGTVVIERSYDDGTSWEVIRSFKSVNDFNAASTGRETRPALLRIKVTAYTSDTNGRAMLTIQESKEYGVVRIAGVTNATTATAEVVKALNATTASKFWSEGAWSAHRGFPRTVALHEQRLYFAGTAYRPQSIWGSIVDDFENFRISANDDSGLFISLSAQESNPIQWMASQDALLIGTAGGEWTLGSSDQDSAITPTNLKAAQQSSYGSKYMRAIIVNDVILFVQRQGRKVRELVYSFEKDGFVAPDLTQLAEHITKGEILEAAFQQQPDAIFWTITGAGQLVGMTYERQQNVVGWHRHLTEGSFESVATTYGTAGDEVWVEVKRTVNGETRRYIERFNPGARDAFEGEDKLGWWYLDCAQRFTFDEPTAIITGLEHLEGLSVDILADGAVSPSRVVEDGAIELQAEASNVLVGLRFVSLMRPQRLDTMLPNGTSRGRKKRIHEMTAVVLSSLGGQFTNDGQNWDWIYSRSFSDPMDSSPAVFSGDKKVFMNGDSNTGDLITIRQAQPLPLTILALVPIWDSNE